MNFPAPTLGASVCEALAVHGLDTPTQAGPLSASLRNKHPLLSAIPAGIRQAPLDRFRKSPAAQCLAALALALAHTASAPRARARAHLRAQLTPWQEHLDLTSILAAIPERIPLQDLKLDTASDDGALAAGAYITLTTTSFQDAASAAATVDPLAATLTGALAGCLYGYLGIPLAWRNHLRESSALLAEDQALLSELSRQRRQALRRP